MAGSVIIQKVYVFHNSPLFQHIDKGSIYDFWISIVTACGIAAARTLINYLMKDRILNLVPQQKALSPEDKVKRATQLCKWCFDIVYYSVTSILAYLIIKDTNFLPSFLGGLNDGSCSNLYQEHPNVPHVKYLRIFYLV